MQVDRGPRLGPLVTLAPSTALPAPKCPYSPPCTLVPRPLLGENGWTYGFTPGCVLHRHNLLLAGNEKKRPCAHTRCSHEHSATLNDIPLRLIMIQSHACHYKWNKCLQCVRTISFHRPQTESKQITAWIPDIEGGKTYTEWWMKQSPLSVAESGLMRTNWSLDLWAGFGALFCSPSSAASGGLTCIERHRIPMMRLMCCITTRAGT